VDYGETVEEAARKELKEETGLDAKDLQFLFYQDSPPGESGGMHCINLYFECEAPGSPCLNHESEAWGWFGPQDMDDHKVLFKNDEGVQRYWVERPS
jgi:8-oxo-dGTP diphosphatase